MRSETLDFVKKLTPSEVDEVLKNLMNKEREKARSLAVHTAGLLASQMRVIGRYDLEEFAKFIEAEVTR